MSSVTPIPYCIRVFSISMVVILICSCDGKIAPFGPDSLVSDTNSEFDSDTATETDGGDDTESDIDTELDTAPGLAGQYFERYNLTNFVFCQRDSVINFDWTDAPPEGLTSVNSISVRWTGWVTPDYSGTYLFSTISDDGVRLWLDDQLIIDAWILQSWTRDEGEIELSEGVPVPLVLEYFNSTGGSHETLLWKHASLSEEIVPAEKFHSIDCVTPEEEPPPEPITGSCLQSDEFNDGSLDSVWQFDELQPTKGFDAVETDSIALTSESSFRFENNIDTGVFLAQPTAGDADFEYMVSSIEGNGFAEMGLMIRENWESENPMVFLGVTNSNEVHFMVRNETNTMLTSVASTTIPSLPYWVRLRFVGDTVDGYISDTGGGWEKIGSTPFSLTGSYLAGIAQNSGSPNVIAVGTGDSFLVNVGNCE